MEGTVKQRLIKYLEEKGVGRNKFEKMAGVSEGYITKLKYAPREDVLVKFLHVAPDLNRVWLLTGEGSMLNTEDEPKKSYTDGAPYYNVDFELGFDLMMNDQTSVPEYFINFAPYNKCTCWCNARGNSMYPTIASGDIIALREVEDFSFLVSGEIYAIVTSNGLRTIKRLKDEGEEFVLVPDNKQDYSEQRIRKEMIIKVFQVLGAMKMF